MRSVACPCCGYYTLTHAANYEVCAICFWEDIPVSDVDMRMTSNRITLRQAQQNFVAFGACEAEYRELVRPPTAEDARISGWRPMEERLRQQQHILLDRFVRHRDALLAQLARFVHDGLLRSIAEADYGMNVEEHLAALRQIHAGKILVPIEWEPREVLELVRWSQPDGPNGRWDGKDAGRDGHLQRAFACTALLHIANEPENSGRLMGSEKDSIIQLIGSILALDLKLQRPALRLLSERMLALDLGDAELPFFALGILLLAATLPDIEPQHLGELGEWVIAEEARLRAELMVSWQPPADQWLLGLASYNNYQDAWQAATVSILEGIIPAMPSSVATVLRAIVERIGM
ncbi:MAG: CPCC family cysteine-rich protein [Caldilineaceae bacterium]